MDDRARSSKGVLVSDWLNKTPSFYQKEKVKKMLNERISKHFCIRFTSEDAQVAIPMMIASILALVVLL